MKHHALYLLCALAVFPITARAQLTTSGAAQVAFSTTGGAPNGFSAEPVSPPNANLVVFASGADNLVANDANERVDVFQYTPEKGIELVSVVPTVGSSPNSGSGSGSPSVSAILPDGSYAVVFTSDARDIVPNYQAEEYNPQQVYIRLPKTNETLLVSVGNGSARDIQTGANQPCFEPYVVSLPDPNRFLVAFTSSATNLRTGQTPAVGGPPNSLRTVFLAQFATTGARTTLVSIEQATTLPNGNPIDANMHSPVISGNGRFVAFSSTGSFGPTNSFEQVYMYDRRTKGFAQLSRDPSGNPGNAPSSKPSISFLADNVAFLSEASNLISTNASASKKALLFNIPTNTLSQVNTAANGVPSNGLALAVRVNQNGKIVSFSDTGSNLGSPTANAEVAQTYVKETVTGAIVRTSVTADGTAGNNHSGGRPPAQITGATVENELGLTLGAASFNSNAIFSSFGSEATNFSNTGSGNVDVFQSVVMLPAPKFIPNGRIESPPDVLITPLPSGKKGADMTIILQQFDPGTSGAQQSAEVEARASQGAKIRYRLEVRKVASKRRIFRVLSRNTTTIRKLSPGRYSVRYRVTRTIGKRKPQKSGYSPKRGVQIT